MKTATIRQVQHGLKDLLQWVEQGQSIEVTRRGKVVALIQPPENTKTVTRPDFLARLKQDFPRGVKGKPASRIISEQREV